MAHDAPRPCSAEKTAEEHYQDLQEAIKQTQACLAAITAFFHAYTPRPDATEEAILRLVAIAEGRCERALAETDALYAYARAGLAARAVTEH